MESDFGRVLKLNNPNGVTSVESPRCNQVAKSGFNAPKPDITRANLKMAADINDDVFEDGGKAG